VKKTVILAIFLFHLGAGLAAAGQFGPAESEARRGRANLGVGYHYYTDNWEFKKNMSADVSQDQFFLHLHLGLFPSGEVYLKLGNANLKIDDGMSSLATGLHDFKAKGRLYETVGIKGVFVRGPFLDVGGFLEGSIFSTYKDVNISGTKFMTDNIYMANVGLTFQHRIEKGIVYAGPFYQYVTADYQTRNNIIPSGTLRTENPICGFVGFQVHPTRYIAFTGELQFRESVSAGASISFRL
jgi:hypothetical protein